MPPLIFWFDPASTYSYLTAMRIDDAAAKLRVDTDWRPILLGPIFRAQGLDNSPFRIFPAKGRYMWRDMEREARAVNAPFRIPEGDGEDAFPRNSVLAARTAIVALGNPRGREFVRRVYTAEFALWQDISDPKVLSGILDDLGMDGEKLVAEANSDATKARLRANTADAQSLGVFGAPSFTVGTELFWGNDRLERALQHASGVAQ